MKKRLIFLCLVLAVIVSLETVAVFSKPIVAFKIGDNLQVNVLAAEKREVSPKKLSEPVVSALTQPSVLLTTIDNEKKSGLLALELIGTAIGNSKDPSAFIKDLDSGKQGIYKLGNVIRQGKIIKIAMGRVVLDVQGQEQILIMSKRGKSWTNLNDSQEPLISIKEDQILVRRSGLINEAAKVFHDLKLVKVSPYYESQKVAGLKVEGLTSDSIIAAAVIHNQDVVTMVNSQKIDSYQKALQVLNKAKGQGEIKVQVLRDGQPQMLSYKFL